MRVDYKHRSETLVDDMYRRSRAVDGVGWAHIPDLNIKAVDRLAKLAEQYAPRGGRMLDMGCGAGDNTMLVAGKGLYGEYWGLDLSEAAIAWAQERTRESGVAMRFVVGSMADLAPCQDQYFDAVWSLAALHWIIGEEDRHSCLTAVHRVLKPGGRFYLWTSGRSREELEPPDETKESYFDPQSSILVRRGQPYFHLKYPEEIRAEVGAAGLEILHWELEERKEGDARYFSGALIVVAGKPAK